MVEYVPSFVLDPCNHGVRPPFDAISVSPRREGSTTTTSTVDLIRRRHLGNIRSKVDRSDHGGQEKEGSSTADEFHRQHHVVLEEGWKGRKEEQEQGKQSRQQSLKQ